MKFVGISNGGTNKKPADQPITMPGPNNAFPVVIHAQQHFTNRIALIWSKAKAVIFMMSTGINI